MVVKLSFEVVTSSSRTLIVLDCVLVDSVIIIGFLLGIDVVETLVVVVVFIDDAGLLVGFRVTNVDLTVEVFIIDAAVVVTGKAEEDETALVVLLSSVETTEKLVVNAESSSTLEIVVDSTLIISLVGFGLGRGALVVSTKEIVVNCSADVLAVGGLVVAGFLVDVAFLREEIVVRRFTARVEATTGFLVVDEVVFITAAVDDAFFVGFGDAGRLVGFALNVDDGDSVETDVRFVTGFLVTDVVVVFVGFTFWTVIDALVTFDGDEVLFLIDSWIDWNVVNLMLSVVLAGNRSSFNLIVVDILRSIILPNVVEKPPALTKYFSVVEVLLVAAGRLVTPIFDVVVAADDVDAVVVINSKVLLL